MSSLAEWPAECLLLVADHLEQRDLNALARTCHRLRSIINPYLYRRSIRDLGPHEVLWWAIEHTSLHTAEYCIEAGADISTEQYWLPYEDMAAIRRLKFRGCLATGVLSRMTEFLAKEANRYRAMFLLLLDRGADVNGRNEKRTALHEAAAHADKEIVRILLQRGADITLLDARGRSPFYNAAHGGNTRILELLLERRAEINQQARNAQGTPLHAAVEWKRKAAVGVLLAHGADPNARNKRSQETPLHTAACTTTTTGPMTQLGDIVQLLINYGADVEAVNYAGNTALKTVVLFGHLIEDYRSSIPTGCARPFLRNEATSSIEGYAADD
ncbi:ankyrin repeat-containing domain protein [Aspergillus granulosus]|uniref:Ankyrin repeat-containing domain protein n=1 Tax=Aspergillus granulosus TaxID=176169 RepID=A0ABR4HJV3_9EURO